MSAAGRYIPRSPRYVLSIEDNDLMRFAAMETRGTSWAARVRDLSETGLAFTLPETETGSLPDEGDMIKIEFTVPGRKQIACFATVVRIEKRAEWDPDWGDRGYTMLALRFRHLPPGHLEAIRLGLRGRARPEDDSQELTLKAHRHFTALCGSSVALALALGLMTLHPKAWLTPLAWIFGL